MDFTKQFPDRIISSIYLDTYNYNLQEIISMGK